MDLRTAAAYLGCSYWTLRDLVLNGHIPAVRHSCKESEAINLLKLREGDIAHGLPVNPKLNRIRFDEPPTISRPNTP